MPSTCPQGGQRPISEQIPRQRPEQHDPLRSSLCAASLQRSTYPGAYARLSILLFPPRARAWPHMRRAASAKPVLQFCSAAGQGDRNLIHHSFRHQFRTQAPHTKMPPDRPHGQQPPHCEVPKAMHMSLTIPGAPAKNMCGHEVPRFLRDCISARVQKRPARQRAGTLPPPASPEA